MAATRAGLGISCNLEMLVRGDLRAGQRVARARTTSGSRSNPVMPTGGFHAMPASTIGACLRFESRSLPSKPGWSSISFLLTAASCSGAAFDFGSDSGGNSAIRSSSG